MVFAYPHVLWLLLIVPPGLIAFFWWASRKRRQLIQQFIPARLLSVLTIGISPARQKLALTTLVTAVTLLIIALARPQWGFVWQEARSRGLDIVVAVDVSKSMLAEDIAPNRLTRARLAVLDLMQQARSDRLGLVAFAGTAFLQCPLTIDDAAFRQSLAALDVNIIPEGGTAIAEAIQTALTAFKEGDNYKILVMFTDGEDQDSGALAAATKAAQAGLKIFTIGLGTREGELLRVQDSKGRTDYIRDESGNVVKSRLNEDLLRQVAGATEGGFYLPLRGAKTIETLYEQGLAPLPKADRDERLMKQYRERYHWPLGAALLLLAFEFVFPTRKPDQTRITMKGREAAVTSLLLAAAMLYPSLAQASASSALRNYRAGDYDHALQEYERLLQKKADDPRLHFNAGAAAYRQQQFDEAAKSFSSALNSPDLNLQQSAYYNRGNSFFHLGDASADSSKKVDLWKKSVQDFDSALKLNGQDGDAQFNRDLVKKRLEELQQQQQPNNQKDDKNQDQQDQSKNQQQQQQNQPNEDQKQDQQKQDQQQQADQQQQQNQDQEKQQQPQQQDSSSGEEKKQEQSQPQPQDQQKQDEQNQKAASSKQGGEKQEETQGENQAEAGQPGRMTPEQARRLLDSQKGDEKILPIPPNKNRPNSRRGPLRDW